MAAEIIDFEERDMPTEASRAFAVYRVAGTGGRSLSATADLLGVPRGTVKSWSSRYRWLQRLAAIDAEDDAESLKAAQAVAASLRLKALSALDGILASETASDRAKVEAARLILDRTGMSATARAVGPADAGGGEHYSDAELAELAQPPEGRVKLLALSSRPRAS